MRKRAKVVFECQNTNDCSEEKNYNVISSTHGIININRVNLTIMIIIIITSNNPFYIYIENSFMKKKLYHQITMKTWHDRSGERLFSRVWQLLRVLFDRKYILTNVDSMEYYFHTQIIEWKCRLPFIAKPKWWNHHQMVIINIMKCGKDKTPTHTQFNGMVTIFKCAKKKIRGSTPNHKYELYIFKQISIN